MALLDRFEALPEEEKYDTESTKLISVKPYYRICGISMNFCRDTGIDRGMLLCTKPMAF